MPKSGTELATCMSPNSRGKLGALNLSFRHECEAVDTIGRTL